MITNELVRVDTGLELVKGGVGGTVMDRFENSRTIVDVVGILRRARRR